MKQMRDGSLMQLHILFSLKNEPWGGGNQFLNALKNEWLRNEIYAEHSEEADVVLLNSYPFGAEFVFDQAYTLKKRFPQKIFVYRLNGPISAIRNTDKEVDQVIAKFNSLLCDGIIFQSKWCQEENKKEFGISSHYETVIRNAPDKNIFNTDHRDSNTRTKLKLIAVSWSSNPRKGFEAYRYLDKNLNFTKYEMTLVGNTDFSFKNIHHIPAVNSHELASILKQHHIFITASQKDPCSNAVVEAISCGLPVVALNDGGHPELIEKGGLLFETKEALIQKIDEVANNLEKFRSQLPTYDIRTAAEEYFTFAQKIMNDTREGCYTPKRISWLTHVKWFFLKLKIGQWWLHRVWTKIRNGSPS